MRINVDFNRSEHETQDNVGKLESLQFIKTEIGDDGWADQYYFEATLEDFEELIDKLQEQFPTLDLVITSKPLGVYIGS